MLGDGHCTHTIAPTLHCKQHTSFGHLSDTDILIVNWRFLPSTERILCETAKFISMRKIQEETTKNDSKIVA